MGWSRRRRSKGRILGRIPYEEGTKTTKEEEEKYEIGCCCWSRIVVAGKGWMSSGCSVELCERKKEKEKKVSSLRPFRSLPPLLDKGSLQEGQHLVGRHG